jgi:isoaspartyl peptidase/L-asparaginase-like protein (Ntn-hydrolase superfamily)
MRIMKDGGSAVDAVEMAVKILEDREITNAGYGSNLAVDGVVECDAVVVDHNGRSGCAGAVAREFARPQLHVSRIANGLQRSRTQYRWLVCCSITQPDP